MSSNNQTAAPGEKRSGGGARNSSIELLRILSMFMIMLHHLVVHNVVDYKAMDPGIFRFLLQFFFVSGGKVGVVIFFAISAWFLADAATGVKASLRRVWMLEKEVLFYSVVLGVGCYLIMDGVGFGALLRGVFPLCPRSGGTRPPTPDSSSCSRSWQMGSVPWDARGTFPYARSYSL